jgi:hypothetical protein
MYLMPIDDGKHNRNLHVELILKVIRAPHCRHSRWAAQGRHATLAGDPRFSKLSGRYLEGRPAKIGQKLTVNVWNRPP